MEITVILPNGTRQVCRGNNLFTVVSDTGFLYIFDRKNNLNGAALLSIYAPGFWASVKSFDAGL